jgi:hypothetical protein
MRATPTTATAEWRFMGQGEVSPRPFGGTESELSLYRGNGSAFAALCARVGRSRKAAVSFRTGVFSIKGLIQYES